jgi:hypothetical protein
LPPPPFSGATPRSAPARSALRGGTAMSNCCAISCRRAWMRKSCGRWM